MRIFGMEIPDNEVPNGTFKQLLSTTDGDYLWLFTAADVTPAEKEWIRSILQMRYQQLLAGVPCDKIEYRDGR